MYHQLYFQPHLSCFHAHLLAPSHIYMCVCVFVLQGVLKNTTLIHLSFELCRIGDNGLESKCTA